MTNASPRFTYHPPQGAAPAVRFDNETGEAWALVISGGTGGMPMKGQWVKIEDPNPSKTTSNVASQGDAAIA